MITVFKNKTVAVAMVVVGLFMTSSAWAQVDLEAVKGNINTNWSKSMPSLPAVTKVYTTPITGLYEVVAGGDVFYTDIKGDYVMMGELLDLKGKRNLTDERTASLIEKIDFKKLPFENAIVIKRGNGARKLVVFEDPNCSYCHKFEQNLMQVNNVTLYVFLYPILSADSHTKAKDIWCAPDRVKTWENWMIRQQAPGSVSACDVAPINANVMVGKKYSIKGTPTLVFEDGSRIGGAVGPEVVEERLKAIYKKYK